MAVKLVKACVVAFAAAVLAACGGGGGGGGGSGGSAPQNRAPVAVAVAAANADIGQLITFDGAASTDPDGNALSYSWQLTSRPAGSAAALSSGTAAAPTLRPDLAGTYTASLTVSDGSLSSAVVVVTTTVVTNAADETARSANVQAVVDLDAGTVTVSWSHAFAGAAYRIERLAMDGSYVEIRRVDPPAGSNLGDLISWTGPHAGSATYRVIALFGAQKERSLLTAAGQAQIAIVLPDAPQIVLGTGLPLMKTVDVSVASLPAGATVSWQVDTLSLGSGNPLAWNTLNRVDGGHVLRAQVDLGGGVVVRLSRAVATKNSMLAIETLSSRTGNVLTITVRVTTAVRLPTVTLSLDGTPTFTRTIPNTCSSSCGGANPDIHTFTISTATMAVGDHVASARVVDSVDGSATSAHTFVVSREPTLEVTLPFDGQYLINSLTLRGSASSPFATPVRVRGTLGSTSVLDTTASTFDTTYNVSSVPAGEYSMRFTAENAFQQTTSVDLAVGILPQVATSRLPIPLGRVGRGGRPIAAAADLVVFEEAETLRKYVKQSVAPYDVYQLADATFFNGVAMNADWIYAGQDNCGAIARCIRRWSTSSGATTVLIDPAASIGTSAINPVAKGRFVVWQNKAFSLPGLTSSLTVYDSQTGTMTNVALAGEIEAFDFEVVAGAPVVYLWGTVSAGGVGGYSLYRWSQSTGMTQVEAFTPAGSFAPGALFRPFVHATGTTVIYNLGRQPNTFPGGPLLSRPISGGAATTLSPTIFEVAGRYGIVVWRDQENENPTYKAWSAAQGVKTLLQGPSFPLVEGSNVELRPGSAVYALTPSSTVPTAWDAATGLTRPLKYHDRMSGVATEFWTYYLFGLMIYGFSQLP